MECQPCISSCNNPVCLFDIMHSIVMYLVCASLLNLLQWVGVVCPIFTSLYTCWDTKWFLCFSCSSWFISSSKTYISNVFVVQLHLHFKLSSWVWSATLNINAYFDLYANVGVWIPLLHVLLEFEEAFKWYFKLQKERITRLSLCSSWLRSKILLRTAQKRWV
jgi:hypothetical protein